MKEKIFKIINSRKLIILVTIAVVGFFYWFQLRPTIVRRQCSWFTYTTSTPAVPAVPAFPGVNKEEAEKEFEELQSTYKTNKEAACTKGTDSLSKFVCDSVTPPPSSAEELIQAPRPAIPAIPEGPKVKVTRAASDQEYSECLRHAGVIK
jgi:hypothetical protein